jgi:hypothetical protein
MAGSSQKSNTCLRLKGPRTGRQLLGGHAVAGRRITWCIPSRVPALFPILVLSAASAVGGHERVDTFDLHSLYPILRRRSLRHWTSPSSSIPLGG